ncbi:DUF4863 family protein [Piscinibacter koreensis]|uniref:DUF4863 family protein n=1 Tax=Piscinibacter koreensis TaxID=2742824 RepID=A0A7Y6NKC5_9BURK|nr:DUF4863 family protein [Schlegelella koreensis]NUZ04740.1 DUF4863 family protein [Schlegelella koreensis]
MFEPEFATLVAELTQQLRGVPLDAALEQRLNAEHGPGTPTFERLAAACRAGVAEGWMCRQEAGGIRYGRVIAATPATGGFSVDVVDMNDVAGPNHVHPNGEIDMVVPMDGAPTFDGQGAGWKVYPPGSMHQPTVTGGRALVLYLLPEGSIRFTRERAAVAA